MKVAELIEQLKQTPQDYEVYINNELTIYSATGCPIEYAVCQVNGYTTDVMNGCVYINASNPRE